MTDLFQCLFVGFDPRTPCPPPVAHQLASRLKDAGFSLNGEWFLLPEAFRANRQKLDLSAIWYGAVQTLLQFNPDLAEPCRCTRLCVGYLRAHGVKGHPSYTFWPLFNPQIDCYASASRPFSVVESMDCATIASDWHDQELGRVMGFDPKPAGVYFTGSVSMAGTPWSDSARYLYDVIKTVGQATLRRRFLEMNVVFLVSLEASYVRDVSASLEHLLLRELTHLVVNYL